MKNYEEALNIIDDRIKNLQEEKRELIKQWRVNESPVKIGDKVTVNGHAYAGKKMIVSYVTVSQSWSGRWFFYARGEVIKKSGEVGNQKGEWFSNK